MLDFWSVSVSVFMSYHVYLYASIDRFPVARGRSKSYQFFSKSHSCDHIKGPIWLSKSGQDAFRTLLRQFANLFFDSISRPNLDNSPLRCRSFWIFVHHHAENVLMHPICPVLPCKMRVLQEIWTLRSSPQPIEIREVRGKNKLPGILLLAWNPREIGFQDSRCVYIFNYIHISLYTVITDLYLVKQILQNQFSSTKHL